MIDFSDKLKDLPDLPGVYIMKDACGEIIYIGKAKILKNRVRQYFHKSGNKSEKVILMVNKIHDFSYIVTPSEKEALSLESNLIKKHKPYYNILLKDDKSYPYIKVNLKERFPKFFLTRKVKNDGCKYFGPLMAGIRSKDILDTLAICFKVRLCNLNMEKVPASHRPCLNYHIDRCFGLCKNYITEQEYGNHVADAINFLRGNTTVATQVLQQKMQNASDNLDFETAIIYKNRLDMLSKLKEKVVTNMNKDIDIDVFAYCSNDQRGVISLLVIRGGKIVSAENYSINSPHMSDDEIYSGFLMQYYKDGILIPDQIILPVEMPQSFEEVLRDIKQKKVNVVCPKQGMLMQLYNMCQNNASEYLEKAVDIEQRKTDNTIGAAQALQKYIGADKYIRRMECYDISNISGTDKVASMVVFIDGEKAVKHYRRFKIKTVEGSNDFASMKEVIERRFAHLTEDEKDLSFAEKPDLVVIDGGKGQLSYSVEALLDVCQNVNIISLAKREEEVFLPNRSLPVIIPKNSVALKLLQRIRDEAHRFAITYHRSLRQSHMNTSRLDEIDGIGAKKRKALFDNFKTVKRIAMADINDIASVDGIGIALATKIKEGLKNNT